MNATVNPWQVQIRGWTSDLEHLVRYFENQPRRVVKDEQDGSYLYESDAFSACSSSEEVLNKANEELRVLSGVLKLSRNSPEALRAGAVYRRHVAGGRDVFVHIQETLQVRVEAGDVVVEVTDSEGNVVVKPSPPPRSIAVASLSATDNAVAKAMRLFAAPDALTWVGLYRIYEVIEADVGGESAFKNSGLGSATDLKRFKHSENSVSVGGDLSRHGKELMTPPVNPMSLEEASSYTTYILSAWLGSKGA